jgi:plastocyanin
LAVVALIGAMAACGSDDNSTTDTTAGGTTTTAKTPTGIEVGAGMNDPDDAQIAVLQFMPAKITVEVGKPVTWTWNGAEPHSVTFLAPGQELPDPGSDDSVFAPTPPKGPIDGSAFVNSGLQPLGPAAPPPFELSFSKAGTFEYHCVIHPQMVGEVTVKDAGATVDSPADVAERRASEADKWLAEGRAAKKAFDSQAPKKVANSDGSTTYTVLMGTSTPHTDILAFSPAKLDLKSGDKVSYLNDSGAPHTASFFGKGAEPIQDPTDPRVGEPAPGPSPQDLTAAGFYNTGLLPPNAPPGAGPPEAVRSFTFNVSDAGDYAYVCLLHSPSQMVATLKVT